MLRRLITLEITDKAVASADALLSADAVLAGSPSDARHIAIAAVYNIAYLLTWNQTHIANPRKRTLIHDVCEAECCRRPEIYKPSEILGGYRD